MANIRIYVLVRWNIFFSTVPDILFRFDEITSGHKVFAAVVDQGYFSLDKLARFVDRRSRVIMAAKTDAGWVRQAIEDAIAHLWLNKSRIRGQHCWGHTVEATPEFEDRKPRKLWVHVYRSDRKSEDENNRFYESLEKFEHDWLHWKPVADKCGVVQEPDECPATTH